MVLLAGSVAFAAHPLVWHVGGTDPNTLFAESLAAGDLDGDGFDELIIAEPQWDPAGSPYDDRGRVHVHFGGPDGPAATAGWTFEGDQTFSELGWNVVVPGDVNGDGYDDLAAVALFESGAQPLAGAVWVFFGGAGGPGAAPDQVLEGAESQAYFGYYVATPGDMDGDGFADLAVSADQAAGGDGEIRVFHGSASGFDPVPDVFGVPAGGGLYFGRWSTAADVNGDGLGDVIANIAGTVVNTGQIFGGTFDRSEIAIEGGLLAGLGDLDGDGFDELGASYRPWVCVGSVCSSSDDRFAIHRGGPTGVDATPWRDLDEGTNDGFYGWYTATLDADADGHPELVLSGDPVRLYPGGPEGPVAGTSVWQQPKPPGEYHYGESFAVGDYDGDGFDDLALGAMDHPAFAPHLGDVWTFFGTPKGLTGHDLDADGLDDTEDPDMDGDLVDDLDDSEPAVDTVCGVDADADGCDDCASGVLDAAADGPDADADGICDRGDPDGDRDGDGVVNAVDTDLDDPFVCGVDADLDTCEDCASGHWDVLEDGADLDADGTCDAADPDVDGDGVDDVSDPAPLDGTVCGLDADVDTCDDCASGAIDPARDGADQDRDGVCDATDPDVDGDGVDNVADPSPGDPRVCGLDADADGCDDCRAFPAPPDPGLDGPDLDADGVCDAGDADQDGDGVDDGTDGFPRDPARCGDGEADGCDDCASGVFDPLADGADTDADGTCDAADPDDDGDGVPDVPDTADLDRTVCADRDRDTCDDCSAGAFDPAADGLDTDGDGACDAGDADDDADTVPDADDTDALDPLVCEDLDADGCDDCMSGAVDPATDGADLDADGLCDAGDPDDDADGVDDARDAAPTDVHACRDADGDGCDDCGSGTDAPDADGADLDGDGLCDLGDADDDADGVEDPRDTDPADPAACRDADGDGCDDCASGTDDPASDGADLDADGQCDDGDTDDDDDGVADADDPRPADPAVCGDADDDACDDCAAGCPPGATDDPPTTGGTEAAKPAGCGCASGPAGAGVLPLAVALGALAGARPGHRHLRDRRGVLLGSVP